MNLICGINPVLEALAAGTRHFDRLLVVKGLRSRRLSDAIGRATRLGIPLRFEMRETLDRLAGGVPHQGVIAVVSAKPVLTLEELLEGASDPALLVALDGVEDPRNLGAILRSAEAAGADGALLPDRHSAGLSETVGRASAGALEHVRVARVGNLVHSLEALKARGIWIVGFDASGTERWDEVDLKGSVCVVLGGEARGIRRLVRERCDHLVSIPHFGHVSSLNVSVAAGIALYEAVRQRGAVPSTVRPIPLTAPDERHIVGPGPEDGETDPGAVPGSEMEEEGEGDDDLHGPAILPTSVDIHGDEVAWGRGPTVLKPVYGPRRRRGAPTRRRKTAPRRSKEEAPAARREDGVEGPVADGEEASRAEEANPAKTPPQASGGGRQGRHRSPPRLPGEHRRDQPRVGTGRRFSSPPRPPPGSPPTTVADETAGIVLASP
jgi:23S rRNA (guanosine2251-2'-O)-methyltransferase